MAYVTHGVLCYCKGSYDKAEKYLLKGMNFSLGKDYNTYAQLLVKSGDSDKAKIYYKKKAEETFKQCRADKYLETIVSYK